MPSTYIPRRDADLHGWLLNFATNIAAAPAKFGLDAGDAAEISAAVDAFHAAFLTASAPSTRTLPAVRVKDDARAAALRTVRKFAALIRADDSVSSELKLDLGLHVRRNGMRVVPGQLPTTPEFELENRPGSPIPAPATPPLIMVVRQDGGVHTLRLLDAQATTRKGKPAGAASALVFRAVADGPVRTPDEASFYAVATRVSLQSRFGPIDNGGERSAGVAAPEFRGKTATYFARWANAKGELGPWSLPAYAPIVA